MSGRDRGKRAAAGTKGRDAATHRLASALDEHLAERLEQNPAMLDAIPAQALATLMANRAPKAKPLDEDFEAKELSLASLVEGLDAMRAPGKVYAPGVAGLRRQHVLSHLREARARARALARRGDAGAVARALRAVAREVAGRYEAVRAVAQYAGVPADEVDRIVRKQAGKVSGDVLEGLL